MTVFDYSVVMVVAASLLLGMWRGVVGEIIALVAWIRKTSGRYGRFTL